MTVEEIWLNGRTITKDEVGLLSVCGFEAEVVNFLKEWWNDSPYMEVKTSGSTGTPKQYRVEKNRMVNSAKMTLEALQLQKDNTALLCMPVSFIAGKMMIVRAIVGKLRLYTATPSGHPLEGLRIPFDFVAMTPMQVHNTLQITEERAVLSQVKELLIGGGALNEELRRVLATFPHRVWSSYGMTETLSHIALQQVNGNCTAYYPLKGVRIGLSARQTLLIEAPHLCPEVLETNDIAQLTADGGFHIIGRTDNVINSGGIKIQIEEVERALSLSIPYAVTGVPHEKFGEIVVLLVEKTIPPCLHQKITDLPLYWRPKMIYTVEQLPQTPTGKPDRMQIKQLAQSLHCAEVR